MRQHPKAKQSFICIGIAAVLVACGQGSQQSTQQQVTPQNVPTTILLDRSNTIQGTDSTRSGIRDDIQSLISRMATSEDRKEVENLARAYQNALLTPNDRDGAVQAQRNIEDSFICLSRRREDYEEIASTLLAATVNTEVRFMALVQYERTMTGIDFQDLPNPVCN